jgi:N-acetylglucosaminyl-diphospho-decaprenol L-rhamnosyltransferase
MASELSRSAVETLRVARAAVPSTTQVAVVVVNFNSGPYLARCLAALRAQTFRDFMVVVVDNASSDESLQALSDLPAGWRVIRLEQNTGFAAANNRAIAAVGSPWIAALNPDAFAEPDWLAQLMRGTARYPDAAAFGSLQIDGTRPDRLDGVGDVYHVSGLYWRGGFRQPLAGRNIEGEIMSPCAAAALYHRDSVWAVGGFDGDFFCYGEDVDLGFRLRLAGHRSIQLANAVVRHIGGGSGGRRGTFARYHGARNRLWVFVKDMPPAFFWPLLPVHLLTTLAMAVPAALNGELGAFARGLRDGLIGLPVALRKRREIQRAHRGAILPVLCWSPLAAVRRRPIVRLTPALEHLERAEHEGGVAIAMVSYRTGPVLFASIDAALADGAVERLVLVDNGNSSETRAELARRAASEPRLRIIEGQGNIGFAAGCNLAVRHCESDYVLLLNPDCVLPNEAAQKFRAELRRRDAPGLLGAVMVDEDGTVQRATRRNLPTPANLLGEALHLYRLIPGWPRIEIEGDLPVATIVVPAISGAAMFLTLENYWALGGLDSGFFLHVEDLDFCARFQAADGEVCLVPGIRARHTRSSSESKRLTIEWHKSLGFRRYFRKRGLPIWQRPLMDLAIFARLALVAIASLVRPRGSGSSSGAASTPPDRP